MLSQGDGGGTGHIYEGNLTAITSPKADNNLLMVTDSFEATNALGLDIFILIRKPQLWFMHGT